jgi:hypothetical protein
MSDNEETRACMGAPTVTEQNAMGDMERCLACGAEVRWDLVDHPFWGFKACCDMTDACIPSESPLP